MSTFKKGCGMFSLEVTEPSPRWVRIYWDGIELGQMADGNAFRAHIQFDDLKDLRFLIDRAIERLR